MASFHSIVFLLSIETSLFKTDTEIFGAILFNFRIKPFLFSSPEDTAVSYYLLHNIPNWTKDSVPASQEYDVTWAYNILNMTRWRSLLANTCL